MKKETKSKDAPKEHKQPWQEKYATPEEIKAMLDNRVSLRYNEVRGRTEIHWLSQGPVLILVSIHTGQFSMSLNDITCYIRYKERTFASGNNKNC